jgi:iron complex transport system substrate-binding protein
MGRTVFITLASLLVVGAPYAADAQQRPQRIASMNLCTDQLLVRLVEPSRIVSLNYLSYRYDQIPEAYRAAVASKPQNHGLAEEILMLQPDLVLAGQFSTTTTTPLLRRLGVRVELFAAENSFADMRANIRKLAAAVGEPARGEKLIADFDRDLAALRARVPPGPMPVYADIGVNHVMAGAGTLMAEVANSAGFRTVGEAEGFRGYQTIPLERLLAARPDLVSSAGSYADAPSLSTLALDNPLIRRLIAHTPTIAIPGRYTDCANPDSLNAVAMLLDARRRIEAAKGAR